MVVCRPTNSTPGALPHQSKHQATSSQMPAAFRPALQFDASVLSHPVAKETAGDSLQSTSRPAIMLDASVLLSHIKQGTTRTEVPVHTALAFDASRVSHHAAPGNTKPCARPPQNPGYLTTPVKSQARDRKGKSVEFHQPHIYRPRHGDTAQPLSSYGTHCADSCSCRNDDELRTLQSEIDCLKATNAQLEGQYGSFTRQYQGAHPEPPLYEDIHKDTLDTHPWSVPRHARGPGKTHIGRLQRVVNAFDWILSSMMTLTTPWVFVQTSFIQYRQDSPHRAQYRPESFTSGKAHVTYIHFPPGDTSTEHSQYS